MLANNHRWSLGIQTTLIAASILEQDLHDELDQPREKMTRAVR
jgi:hypothetical protein